MDSERKQFIIWMVIAGIIFIIISIHDLFFLKDFNKSNFLIGLEIVAGLLFLLNAFVQWKKSKS